MKKILSLFATAALLAACVGTNGESTCDKKCSKECPQKEVATEATPSTPDAAIAELKAGNKRFVTEVNKHPRKGKVRLNETLNTQYPYVAVVACSDSRVPVELLFDQGIGDIFVIRTAGNSVSPDVMMGSVDYAVDHLEVPLVVVLGHQNCGGVTSAIAAVKEGEHHHHNGKIGELLEIIQADVKPFIGHPEKLEEAIQMNTEAQVKRINDVDYIQKRVKEGKLKVVGAYYNLETGEVIFQ